MNIINLNEKEIERLYEVQNRNGFVAETFNMYSLNRIPLTDIRYKLQLDSRMILELNLEIKKGEGVHIYNIDVYANEKYCGNVVQEIVDLDPFYGFVEQRTPVIKGNAKYQEMLQRSCKLGIELTNYVFYSMNHLEKEFGKSVKKNNQRKGNAKQNKEAVLYRKINAFARKGASNDYAEKTTRKMTHEFEVRGHIRHLKNGKQIWINPYTKCKGKGKKINHEYIVVRKEK